MEGLVPVLLGSVIMGLPCILLAWIAFRKERALFLFALALIVVGLGYLATTQTPIGVARLVLGNKL